ncbi:MAG: class I SAM-dependent methyltransferase [Candidatus Acidiferrum sp.]
MHGRRDNTLVKRSSWFTASSKRDTVRGMSSASNVYDTVPYPSLAFLQTHPDRLAVLGALFGMNPPPVEHCRVLELACGDGSNLIPMAYALPGSEFVGVDLAVKPVASAQGRILRLGLTNIRIEAMDLMQVELNAGNFDYIIAHGVYAWVPEHVQKKILAICGAHLSPNGVAFVSYNTTPAGRVRQILREMTAFHEKRTAKSASRVQTNKNFLDAISRVTDKRSPWKTLLQEELKLTFNRDEKVVFHDDLADCFLPVSFGDFVERAAKCGLQYLSEAHLGEMIEPALDAEASAVLSDLADGDEIAFQQYLDFARYRRFRQTLLCHKEVVLRRGELSQRVKQLLAASPMRISAEKSDGAIEFSNIRGPGTITTNNPVVIAALRRLEAIWPRAESFTQLADAVVPRFPDTDQSQGGEGLAQAVLKLAANQLLDLRTYNLPLPNTITEKPMASLLARDMVKEGPLITTLLHTQLDMEDELGRKFLQLLDGTRNRESLIDALAAESRDVPRETMSKQVDASLLYFHRMGLLIA